MTFLYSRFEITDASIFAQIAMLDETVIVIWAPTGKLWVLFTGIVRMTKGAYGSEETFCEMRTKSKKS